MTHWGSECHAMIMVASFVIAVIAAILLALRFTVFVLVPATLLTAAAIVAVGHQPKVTMALTLLGTVVLLQIGYLVGWTIGVYLQKRTQGAIRRFLFKVDRAL
jgi:hypothetical protein